MNHTFVGSLTDPEKCRQCKRDEKSHGKEAECESCGETGPCDIMDGNILACGNCQERNKEVGDYIESLGPTREQRVDNVKAIMQYNGQIDDSIKMIPDMFNAKTVAIVKLAAAIDSDDSVPADQKHFRLAQVLDERYKTLKEAVQPLRVALAENENEQRAIQQYYNELAKKLRNEEREKIRLRDLTYTVNEPGKISKPKSPSTKSASAKDALPWVEKLELEFPHMKGKAAGALQAIIVAQSKTPEAAYNIFKGMLSGKL